MGALKDEEVVSLTKQVSTDDLKTIKYKIRDILKEFYAVKEMSTKETVLQLYALQIPSSLYYEIVKNVVVAAMDNSLVECDMASQLLVDLTSAAHFVQPEDAQRVRTGVGIFRDYVLFDMCIVLRVQRNGSWQGFHALFMS